MVILVVFCLVSFRQLLDNEELDETLTANFKTEYIDLKATLAQNQEQKIEKIFSDYLFFPADNEGEEKTREDYKRKVDDLFGGKEPRCDISENGIDDDIRTAYEEDRKKLAAIDEQKVPEGATLEQVRSGEIAALVLDVQIYKEEYRLWNNCYIFCPTAASLQQMGRSALDVQTMMMRYDEYQDDWDVIIEYAGYGIQDYNDLLYYESASESKADCCYWIAKTFYDLAQNMPDEYSIYNEHCYLMAFAFAEKGISYSNAGNAEDDHILELIKIRNRASEILDGLGL